MAIVGNFRAGKGGRVQVIDQALTICKMMKYSAKENAADLDTTNFENTITSPILGTVCYTQGLVGPIGADFSVSGNWDAAQNPLDDPPGFYVRDDGPELVLFTNRTDNIFYDFLLTRFLSTTLDVDVNGLVTFSVDGKSQAAYNRPVGSVNTVA